MVATVFPVLANSDAIALAEELGSHIAVFSETLEGVHMKYL